MPEVDEVYVSRFNPNLKIRVLWVLGKEDPYFLVVDAEQVGTPFFIKGPEISRDFRKEIDES